MLDGTNLSEISMQKVFALNSSRGVPCRRVAIQIKDGYPGNAVILTPSTTLSVGDDCGVKAFRLEISRKCV